MRKIYLILSLAFIFMLGCENHLEMTLPEGPQGEQGPQGEDGLSAFDLWKIFYQKGPNTTFEDFMESLRGKDGKDGKDGAIPVIGANDNWWIDGKDTGIPARGKDGKDGVTPEIGANGNWFIDGKDTGVSAEGKTPVIGANGNWWINGEDSGVPATGKDGKDGVDGVTPQIGANGNWWINGQDTGVPVTGKDGKDGMDGIDGKTPFIGSNGNWWFDCCDTGVPARGEDGKDGKDGVSPKIGSNGNWWIGDQDTGVRAAGVDGVTPEIGGNGNWWLNGKDTGVPVTGKDGKPGVDGITPVIGDNGNWVIDGCDTGVAAKGEKGDTGASPVVGDNGNWVIDGCDTGVPATGPSGKDGENGIDGIDGVTPEIGHNGNWWIKGKDTGQPAIGKDGVDADTPEVGSNGNWWVGNKDTGVPAEGKDGVTPLIGFNGNWFIDGVDTGHPAIGKDGKNGLDGVNGVSPHVGENGNWWIDDVDTDVPAKGADGLEGATPEIGENGNWYIKGEDTGKPAVGKDGANGLDGKTSYELWKEAVDNGDMTNKDGSEYTGGNSWEEFLKWLQGGDVSVLHQYWLSQGNEGDLQAFIEALFSCHCDNISVLLQAIDACLDLDSEGNIIDIPTATLYVMGDEGTTVQISGDNITTENKTMGANEQVTFVIPRSEEDKFVTITAVEPEGDPEDPVTKIERIPAYKYVKFNSASIEQVSGEEKDAVTVTFEDAPIKFLVKGSLVYDTTEGGIVDGSGWEVSGDGKTFTKTYERTADVQTLTFRAEGDDGGCSILKDLITVPQLTPVDVTNIVTTLQDCSVKVVLTGTPGMTVTMSGLTDAPIEMVETPNGTYTGSAPRSYSAQTATVTAMKEGAGTVTEDVQIDGEMLLPSPPFTVQLIGGNDTSGSNSANPSLELKLGNPNDKDIDIVISRGTNSSSASLEREPWIKGVTPGIEEVTPGENSLTVTVPANDEVVLNVNKDVRPNFGSGNYSMKFETKSFCGVAWDLSKTINNQRDFSYGFKKVDDEDANDGSGWEGPGGGWGGSDPWDPDYEVPQIPEGEEDDWIIFETWVTNAIPGQYAQFMLTTSKGYNSIWGAGKKTDENGNLKILVMMKKSDVEIANGKKGAFRLANEPLPEDFTHSKDFTFNLPLD